MAGDVAGAAAKGGGSSFLTGAVNAGKGAAVPVAAAGGFVALISSVLGNNSALDVTGGKGLFGINIQQLEMASSASFASIFSLVAVVAVIWLLPKNKKSS